MFKKFLGALLMAAAKAIVSAAAEFLMQMLKDKEKRAALASC